MRCALITCTVHQANFDVTPTHVHIRYNGIVLNTPLNIGNVATAILPVELVDPSKLQAAVLDIKSGVVPLARVQVVITSAYLSESNQILKETIRHQAVCSDRDNLIHSLETQRNLSKAALVTLQQEIDRDCRDKEFVSRRGHAATHAASWRLALERKQTPPFGKESLI